MKVFISYTRLKDEFNAVSDFQKHLANEVGQNLPGSTVFQDKNNIGAGDNFAEKLIRELEDTDVLVILLSPTWLVSGWCRREYEFFTSKELRQGRHPRVLPVIWIPVDADDDVIAQELLKIQYEDWSDLRHEDWSSPNVRRQIARLAERAAIIAKRKSEG